MSEATAGVEIVTADGNCEPTSTGLGATICNRLRGILKMLCASHESLTHAKGSAFGRNAGLAAPTGNHQVTEETVVTLLLACEAQADAVQGLSMELQQGIGE